ncbi:DUF397 domain-containing protein [Streptomyces sp. SID8382]|uniref:DUF397 domain-containing protein n=1 Tax=Streptomyces malaysiensis TaxID=92644 RepID=UPI000C2C2B3B|nr:hypothetical protein CFP59_02734 [Streptomyces sp. M56]MYX59264.1 DUF397 domain-containing protein [Streptomyces sp. SID8382]
MPAWRKSSYSAQGSSCIYLAEVPASWQKSSYSHEGSNCVYVAAPAPHTIALRESDEPDVILTTTPAALGTFIRAAKGGAFDGLIGDR